MSEALVFASVVTDCGFRLLAFDNGMTCLAEVCVPVLGKHQCRSRSPDDEIHRRC